MSSKFHDVIKLLSASLRKHFKDYKGIYFLNEYDIDNISEDNEIKIVALFDTSDKQKRESIWPIVGQIETELGVSIDLYPYTQEEFKNDEFLYSEMLNLGQFCDASGITKKS